MKNIVIIALSLVCFFSTAFAQAPIHPDKLYNKKWKISEFCILRPGSAENSKIVIYARGQTSQMDLDNIQITFKPNGTVLSTDVAGNPRDGTWEFKDGDSIKYQNDRLPSKIAKLSDEKLVLQMPQIYTSPDNGKEESIITQITYTAERD